MSRPLKGLNVILQKMENALDARPYAIRKMITEYDACGSLADPNIKARLDQWGTEIDVTILRQELEGEKLNAMADAEQQRKEMQLFRDQHEQELQQLKDQHEHDQNLLLLDPYGREHRN